jgi:2-polyprenyl-3-methyl-5-hydroxy-6-metoxy-1,4-benzoquinol methylase
MSECHICGLSGVRELPQYASLSRVTSDCKPWPAGGRLGVCASCGTVQKFVDARWEEEIARIYSDYTIYFQAGGAEQAVFLGERAEPMTRSGWLVQRFVEAASLPAQGRLLDVGCGNGALLRAFSAAMPGWTLAGTEISDGTRAMVEAIPRVEALHTGALHDVPGQFDAITLTHVLEHISRPRALLDAVAAKLAPGGVVFVQVPDAQRNPFDLLIADHISHFTAATATRLVEAAGFRVLASSQSWVVKEISLMAGRDGQPAPQRPAAGVSDTTAALDWLFQIRAAARGALAAARGPFGIFGSSIAATWLAHELGCAMDFFVDEDPGRQGRLFMGRPVMSPSQVPPGSVVFIGIGGGVATTVAARLSRSVPAVSWSAAPPPV